MIVFAFLILLMKYKAGSYISCLISLRTGTGRESLKAEWAGMGK